MIFFCKICLSSLEYGNESNIIHFLQRGVRTLEFYDLDAVEINKEALKHVSKELCEEYKVFPYDIKGRELYLAACGDLSQEKLKYLSFLIKKNIKPSLGREEQITLYINKFYEENYRKDLVSNFTNPADKGREDELTGVKGPIVFLVDSILRDGVLKGASDIHIEPVKENVRIRYRIDGVLIKSSTEIPKSIYENIVTRIKVIAQMDISNRYEVQDGETTLQVHGENYDFRVSSLPTIYGEKFVLRILKRNSSLIKLNNLGFKSEDYELLKNILRFKQGLIIITGPTGSGKTSTLYAMIRELNKESRNIITVEKPVESAIDGINQVSIGSKGNLEYGTVLKAVLRQDPDVIMVGEIIDKDTAETAVRASLTGHLVLTTLHTNDASSTINRLTDMGIDKELLNSSLLLVIAQRLTRTICQECKVEYEPTLLEKGLLGKGKSWRRLYKGTGCKKCSETGFKGRTIAYEIMVIGEKVKEAVKFKDHKHIRKEAIDNGMVTLEDYFQKLVEGGITTVEEYRSNMQVHNVGRALGSDYGV